MNPFLIIISHNFLQNLRQVLPLLQSASEASAGDALNDKPHENFSWFESLLDDCLERVNSALDTAKR